MKTKIVLTILLLCASVIIFVQTRRLAWAHSDETNLKAQLARTKQYNDELFSQLSAARAASAQSKTVILEMRAEPERTIDFSEVQRAIDAHRLETERIGHEAASRSIMEQSEREAQANETAYQLRQIRDQNADISDSVNDLKLARRRW